ncbi:hypothetical protein [Swingsia samuiensis]|uniref:Uncharacterized protein n=1 Tax=Swingsia samuiensis TaxID=1293412 RepID=A0A4Y6UK41_9PROT|nr:hypothetical protein [Swingsia samuiensis]QDH17008.1 hypothetical protein E3D00_05100 [Swingsia samuiensis]
MSLKIRSTLALVAVLSASPALAEPGGCLKYGAAGAVAGHLAHHGVLGAAGGCATGMYRRHAYRKDMREKAALWDKEHPGDPNASWWQRHHDSASVKQKAEWYEAEHPDNGNASSTPAKPAPATPPASTAPAAPTAAPAAQH